MSTDIAKTDRLVLTVFAGGDRGPCLQITPQYSETNDDEGYLQLSWRDAYQLSPLLSDWVHNELLRWTRKEKT